MDERDRFERFVAIVGIPRLTSAAVFAPEMVEDGDCWTGAWREAQERGGRYVEGMAWRGTERIRAHAWVERETPDGVVVVEATKGYETCDRYMGVQIDATRGSPVDLITRAFGDERYSVIEYLFAIQGWSSRRTFAFLQLP